MFATLKLWAALTRNNARRSLGLYTPEERYQRGRDTVDTYMRDAPDPDNVAEHLYNMASGSFNRSLGDRRFDDGVCDRLGELGFEHDRFTV